MRIIKRLFGNHFIVITTLFIAGLLWLEMNHSLPNEFDDEHILTWEDPPNGYQMINPNWSDAMKVDFIKFKAAQGSISGGYPYFRIPNWTDYHTVHAYIRKPKHLDTDNADQVFKDFLIKTGRFIKDYQPLMTSMQAALRAKVEDARELKSRDDTGSCDAFFSRHVLGHYRFFTDQDKEYIKETHQKRMDMKNPDHLYDSEPFALVEEK